MTDDKTVFSKKHKENLSKAAKGKPKSAEHRAKISEGMRRKHKGRRDKNGSG